MFARPMWRIPLPMRKPKVRALGVPMGKGGAYLLSIKLRVCGDFGVKFPDAS